MWANIGKGLSDLPSMARIFSTANRNGCSSVYVLVVSVHVTVWPYVERTVICDVIGRTSYRAGAST